MLVSVDTLRADAVGAYGAALATPVLDALAGEGVLARIALAPAPETAPSHASLFTGLSPPRHGVIRNGVALPEGHATLAEVLRGAGYHTAAFASSFVLDPRFGWDRGFDHYDARFDEAAATLGKERGYPGAFWAEHEFGGLDRRAAETTVAARAWLADVPEPFFLFVHYFDPHLPYVAPPEFAKRVVGMPVDLSDRAVPNLPRSLLARLIRRYHAEVLYTDTQLGELVRAVHARGGARRTLLVVTGDHGEGLGQHNWLEHAVHLYEEQVRVPLIWHWPGTLPAAAHIETPLGLVDVAPTIAALVGAPWPAASDGRSLAEALRDGREPEARPILGHRRAFVARAERHPGQKYSLRSGRWKYIRASVGPDELFDLDADPGELRNLHDTSPDVVAELSRLLEHALADLPESAEPAPLDEEARRKLEALGYLD